LKKIPSLIIFSASYLFILSAIAAFTTLQRLAVVGPDLNTVLEKLGKLQTGPIGVTIVIVLLGGLYLLELFWILILILIPVCTCVISGISGFGLLKREKWSRDTSSLVFGLGLLYYIAVTLLPSDQVTSAQKEPSYFTMFGFLNAICLSLGLYLMRFNRQVNHYFDELDS
jgi:hypothetical protein